MHTISIKTSVPLTTVITIISENLYGLEHITQAKDMGTHYWIEVETDNPLHWVPPLVQHTEVTYG